MTDKYRAKWIAVIGLEISIPAHSLLIIQGSSHFSTLCIWRANFPYLALPGSLPLFIFFLVILGVSLSFFLTPTMQDLSVVVAMTPGLPSTAAYRCFKCDLFYCRGSSDSS